MIGSIDDRLSLVDEANAQAASLKGPTTLPRRLPMPSR